MTLGENIKYIRDVLKISQREFAEELGCSQSAVSAFENGEKNPSYDLLKKMAEFAKQKKVKVSLL